MLAKVFNKGQVVIPVRMRKKYKINIGDSVNIIEEDDGIKIVPLNSDDDSVESLAGIFSKYAVGERIDEKSIGEATEKYFVESVKDEIY